MYCYLKKLKILLLCGTVIIHKKYILLNYTPLNVVHTTIGFSFCLLP